MPCSDDLPDNGTAVYPTTYDPTYALSASVLAFAYAAAFTLLFPLVAPAALLLLSLTLIGRLSLLSIGQMISDPST